MNIIKRLIGKGSEKASSCCSVEIKEGETGEKESCSEVDQKDSCC
jgi:hypothetical protein